MDTEPEFDKDGYPAQRTLEIIANWEIKNYSDCSDLLAFVMRAWEYPEYTIQASHNQYEFSTGGLSGNEEIIDALNANSIFWLMCWESSRRGGHYQFKIRY